LCLCLPAIKNLTLSFIRIFERQRTVGQPENHSSSLCQ
jgi:hypothetical protein